MLSETLTPLVAEWRYAILLAACYGDITKVAAVEFFLVRIGVFQTLAIKTVALSKAFEIVCRNCDRCTSRFSRCKRKKRSYEDAKSSESGNDAEMHEDKALLNK